MECASVVIAVSCRKNIACICKPNKSIQTKQVSSIYVYVCVCVCVYVCVFVYVCVCVWESQNIGLNHSNNKLQRYDLSTKVLNYAIIGLWG